MSNKIWGVILVLSLVIAGVSGYNVIKLSSEYRTGIEEYAALEEYVVVEETHVTSASAFHILWYSGLSQHVRSFSDD